MSTGHTIASAAAGHDAHAHPPFLAHHYDTPEQQFGAGKLGMWIFLATEILMFGGLFCAYAVYRANHPDVFIYAHHYLDRTLGGINTIVLITSSLTMAWGVRCAQLNKTRGLIICLFLTLLGGAGFMGIKTIEYKAKWSHHLRFGQANQYLPGKSAATDQSTHGAEVASSANTDAKTAPPATAPAERPARTTSIEVDPNSGTPDEARIKPPFVQPAGLASRASHDGNHRIQFDDLGPLDRNRVFTFFSVYFVMTGLHGLHVLIGMALITWILVRTLKGHFSSAYNAPVDLVGLYWHLVDLIWIFLFPLLYLIH